MEEGCVSTVRRWEDLNVDILVKIFQQLDMFELTSGIAHVCSSWRSAARDPILWMTLDLSMMESNFIKTHQAPYVYVHAQSDMTLTRLLKIALSLSQGSIRNLVFHYNLFLNDGQLADIAQRYSWNLKMISLSYLFHIIQSISSLSMNFTFIYTCMKAM